MANDYYFDETCKAAYRFEAGYPRTDSQSENHLTSVNSYTESSGDYKEGLCAISLSSASTQYFHCVDSILALDFPLKWDDNPAHRALATRTISCCFWIKLTTTAGRQSIVGKYNPTGDDRCFMIYCQDGNLRCAWGYNEGSSEHVISSSATLSASVWYHVGVSLSTTEQALIFEVWNDTSGTVICQQLEEFILDPIAITEAAFTIGADHNGNNTLNGTLDELLVFNDFKMPNEYALIRHENYTGPIGNFFAFDPECVSAFSFELDPGGLQDTVGTNHLTDYNTVHYDVGPWQELGQSLYLYRPELEYLQRTDANLSSGFPLKSGDTAKTFTVCFWFRLDVRAGTYTDIFSKSATTGGQKSFCIYLNGTQLRFYWGYNSGNSNETISSSSITLDRWYHLGVSVNGGPSPSILFRLYDSVQQRVITHTTYYPTNELSVGAGPFSIGLHQGASNSFYGWVDEFVIFKDRKSKFEIDQIRNGNYFRPLRWGSIETAGHMTPYVPTDTMKVISAGHMTPYVPTDTMKVLAYGLMILARTDLYKFYTNNFASDPDVVAIYTFEDIPGFNQDSSGHGNHLTNHDVEQVE